MYLREVLPKEALSEEFADQRFRKYLDYEVIQEIKTYNPRFPFEHKNIHVWWIIEDSLAVGWNENPSRGWSFPVERLQHRYTVFWQMGTDCNKHEEQSVANLTDSEVGAKVTEILQQLEKKPKVWDWDKSVPYFRIQQDFYRNWR